MAERAEVALVAAVADNGVIGRGGGMPWRLPGDLAHFRETTMGHPILMGRRTFEAIGRPLPGRRNIVLSTLSTREGAERGVEWFPDLDTALATADGRVFVVGGATVYRQAAPLADLVYLTRVHARPDGDTYWDVDLSGWRLTASQEYREEPVPYTFLTYRR